MANCPNHESRVVYAKGLCKSCYHRALRENNVEYAAKQKEYFAKLYSENSERKKAQSRDWAEKNKKKKLAVAAIYRVANKELINASIKSWKRTNHHKVLATNAQRRAVAKQATPIWADKALIADVYAEAKYMQMHVDHIIPLKHPLVCGLHVWDNLQLLSAEANMRKSNQFDPDNYHAY